MPLRIPCLDYMWLENIIIIILLSFFQFGTGGNAQEGQACSKCAHLSHTREPIRDKVTARIQTKDLTVHSSVT